MGSKIWPKEISQIGPMPPQAARLLRILGGLTRQSEGRLGEPVKSRSSIWRASDPLVVQQLSLNDHDQHDQHNWVVGRQRVSPRPLHCFPRLPLAALLSQHHSHFLASPVGYLYERG